jgi:hypothetical protein
MRLLNLLIGSGPEPSDGLRRIESSGNCNTNERLSDACVEGVRAVAKRG